MTPKRQNNVGYGVAMAGTVLMFVVHPAFISVFLPGVIMMLHTHVRIKEQL